MSLNIKRTSQMVALERAVIKMIWDDVKNIPDDNTWRKYERCFTYENQRYVVKCSFRVDNQYLTYKNMVISHEKQTFIIEQPGRLH